MSTDFLFRVLPYAALIVLGAGLVIRYLLALPRMDQVITQLSASWSSFGAGKVLQVCLVILALAHVVAIAFPQAILSWNGSRDRLYILEGVGFAVGVTAFVAWARLAWRQLQAQHPSRLGDLADAAFLSLIALGLLSGVLTAVLYRWASSWGVATLTPYAVSLLAGQPVAEYVAQMPFLVQLHLVTAFAAVAVFPFTRLALFPVAAVHRGFVLVGRPLNAGGRRAEEWLRRHNPGVWIWPKED